MADVYSSGARGLQAGFNMALQADEAAERKKQRAREDERQAVQDERLAKQDTRAGMEFALRQQADARAERRLDEEERRSTTDRAAKALGARQEEIVTTSRARQAAGMPVEQTDAEEYARNAATLKRVRQDALNLFSQLSSGQVDIASVPPADLYMNWTAATGMLPEDLAAMPQHIQDIQAGLETNNPGLTVRGTNGLLAPQLKRGIGEPSPHGGTIVRKEIIGLDPARDANGTDHPNRVIPRLRVYVKTDDGSEKYYDAPMTRNGSGAPDDKIVAIDLQRGMDYMGNMGVLAQAAQDPAIAEQLRKGAAEAGPQAKKYLDDLTAISRPVAKSAEEKKIEAAQKIMAQQPGTSLEQALRILDGKQPNAVQSRVGIIESLPISDKEKVEAKKAIAVGGGRGKGAPTLGGGNTAATNPKDNETIDFWARAVIAGDRDWQVGISRSKDGAELIRKVKERVPQLAKEMGLEPQDIGSTRAESAALSKTLADRQKYVTSVEQLTSTLNRQAELVERLIDKGTAGGNAPLLNKPIQSLRSALGSEDLAAFDTALTGMAREHQRVLTSPLSNAQLHVAAQETADRLVNRNMTPSQIRAVIQVMREEAKNGKEVGLQTLNEVREKIRGLGRGRTGGEGGEKPAGGSAAPAAPAVGTLKGGYRFKGGNPADKASWEKV